MILVIDFGSQFTQIVARRIRELGVYSEIIPYKNSEEKVLNLLKHNEIKGIIFSGGPFSVYEENAPTFKINLEDLSVPLLGICYGFQLINFLLEGKVASSQNREYGFEVIKLESTLNEKNPLYSLQNHSENIVWMSHGDKVVTLAPKLVADSYTRTGILASFHHVDKPIYGVQFHPEVEHSKCGREIIKNFVEKTCIAEKSWNPNIQLQSIIESIKNTVGPTFAKEHVICALSGGVDSTVAAVLASRVFGDNLHCIFVNNGLLRKDEYETTLNNFTKYLKLNVIGVDASELFLNSLKNVTDPEQKRKIIGKHFIDVFEETSQKLPNCRFLVQGTLYPDVIESVPVHGSSVTIKTHHNVGGLPEKMKFKLIEPLKELFKDEVRKLGKELGISDEFLLRHPFPGPGLGIRVIGEVTQTRLQILQHADSILVEELKKNNLYHSTWQAFVVLLPVNTVGVMGDGRTYESVAAIRCVNAVDGMTADWSRLPYEFLAHVSARIINEVKGINRIVYDISSKPPATIEWE